jgi:haloacetate dehalogenase
MTDDLADLFPGFDSRWIDIGMGRLFARTGGAGPPLVLLHGFPQTHVMWHRIAKELAERFTVVAPDLRGYGWSSVPPGADDGSGYSKRLMAGDIVEAMEKLGHIRFAIAGHDRGGRVAYRLALDHPGRVTAIAVLDIVPTTTVWDGFDRKAALRTYHWPFLAQKAPLPETLIGGNPTFFLDWTLASWTASRSLEAFDPRALAHYRASFDSPDRIAAACGDYRAGASIDVADDAADLAAGRKISAPLLALWGSSGFPDAGDPRAAWRAFATDVSAASVASGHFVAEENPQAVLEALVPFLAGGRA